MSTENTLLKILSGDRKNSLSIKFEQILFSVGRALLLESTAEIQGDLLAMMIYKVLKSSGLGGSSGTVVPIFVTGNAVTLPEDSPANFTLVPLANNVYRVDAEIPVGKDGSSLKIEVGKVTTVANKTPATVTTYKEADGTIKIDFSIPEGPQGAKGDTGPKGDTGAVGDSVTINTGTTTTLSAGNNASISLVQGTSISEYILNAAVPKGEKGYSPTAKVTKNSIGDELTVTIKDESGTKTEKIGFDSSDFKPIEKFEQGIL